MPITVLTGTDSGGVKSIPLSAFPPEAWTTLGGDGDNEDSSIAALYERVVWLHRGVEVKVNALTGMPFSVHRKNEGGDEIELTTLPFAFNARKVLGEMYRWYILYGRTYGLAGRSVSRKILDFRALIPTSIKVVYDDEAGIIGYERHIKGKKVATYKPEDMVAVFKASGRKELGYGVSDAMTAANAAGGLSSIDIMTQTLFKNGAINPTLISMGAGALPADRERMKAWFKRLFGGIKKAFSIEVIEGKPEVISLGHKLSDLETEKLTTTKREDIATALGVPQTILFSNAANYATARQDTLNLYEFSVKPDALLFEEAFNTVLFVPQGYYFKFHPERMEVYQQLEADKSSAVIELYNAGLMEYEEAREHMNLAPVPEKTATVDDSADDYFVTPEARRKVLGYHIQEGVVTRNEARATIGLDPIDDSGSEKLRALSGQLSVFKEATSAGIPPEVAAVMVGLDIPQVAVEIPTETAGSTAEAEAQGAQTPDKPEDKPEDAPEENAPPADTPTDEQDAEPDAPPAKSAYRVDLDKWQRLAAKRYKEGRPEKALAFESDVIPPVMLSAIRAQLGTITDATRLAGVFSAALEFESYP